MTTRPPSGRLQLRITIENIEPAIWRRVVVADRLTFSQLHAVIQRAMGWEDCHLHEFQIGEMCIGMKDDSEGFWDKENAEALTETDTTLAAALTADRKVRYWYDFGDDWWHEIVVEKRLPPDPDAPLAVLTDGARACPPEDSGGPWGYADLLAALVDPKHPEHEEIKEWAPDFDPERFNLETAADQVAKAVRKRSKRR